MKLKIIIIVILCIGVLFGGFIKVEESETRWYHWPIDYYQLDSFRVGRIYGDILSNSKVIVEAEKNIF